MEALGFMAMLAVGVSLGLIGGGGSILTVPILVYLLGQDAVAATGYSLFIVGVASAFGAWRYHRLGLINYRAGITFSIPAFVGAFAARRFLVPAIPDVIWQSAEGWLLTRDLLILGVFGVVMVLAAASMIKPSSRTPSSSAAVTYNYPLIALEGVIVGAVTGFVGAGGGFLVIPALVILARVPMKEAIGTSLLIITIKSLVGFAGDLSAGAVVDWVFLGQTTAIASLGIFGGTYLSRFVTPDKLKPAFGWFVLVIGVGLLAKNFA
jgi:uncharacterized membrane protein YfcA